MRKQHNEFSPGDRVTVIPEKGGSFIKDLAGRALIVQEKITTKPVNGQVYYSFENFLLYSIREDCLRLVEKVNKENIPDEIANDSFCDMVLGGV